MKRQRHRIPGSLIASVACAALTIVAISPANAVTANAPNGRSSIISGHRVSKMVPFSFNVKFAAKGSPEYMAIVRSSVKPDSASGCNVDVCEEVYGSGLTVTGWKTHALWGGGQKCTQAYYIEAYPSTVVFYGDWVCGSGPGVFYGEVTSGLPRGFPNGKLLCAHWYAINGRPCETVHA
jgi:hypothetical protein